MKHFNKLIRDLVPQGVAHRTLGEIAKYSDTRVDANKLDATNFIGVDNLLADKGGKTEASYLPNTARVTSYENGDVLLGNIRPYLKKIWLASGNGGCSGDVLAIRISETFRDSIYPEFLYYLLSSDGFFAYNMQHAKGAKMPRGSKEAILNYRVPLPPLEVQREIVRILDQFTRLKAELEAELEARRHQYDHYRRKVMTPRSHWTTERLGDVVEFENAKAHERLVDPTGDVTLLTAGFISAGAHKARFVRSEDVLTPALLEDVALVMSDLPNGRALARAFFVDKKDKYAANQRVCLLRPISTNQLDARFLYYTVNRNSQLLAYDSGVDQTHLKKGWILDIQIGIPPVEEQKMIAKMLDKFDTLVNDLGVGLPAEIAARRRQYEYYLDRLLTFREAVA